nr:MAG TPA: hypothetical protein [Caudoviricetes sp.]
MVGLFGRFKVFFQTRLKLVNIFNVRDDKRTTNDFFANRRNPDGIAISHKALYRSIIDCTSEPAVSELDGGICQLKRNVAVFSIGDPSGYTKCNHVQPKPKNQLFYEPLFRQMILFIHLRVPFVLYHNHSIDRVITS